uniref:Protein ABSCISIC ACID-INSENSITIVE 5 n=1 Tax=Aegilops tauschii TaxID=37682 RepID=M8CM34_AEGTA
MDEFMSNIWNVEVFQAAIGGGLVGMEEAAGGSGGGGDAGGSGVCRQGSFSLPPPLRRKTVEEVWAGINREPRPVHAQPQVARPSSQLPAHPTVGNGRKSFYAVMLPSDDKSAIHCSHQDACRGNGSLVFANDRQGTLRERCCSSSLSRTASSGDLAPVATRLCRLAWPWTDKPRAAGAAAWPNHVPDGTDQGHVLGDGRRHGVRPQRVRRDGCDASTTTSSRWEGIVSPGSLGGRSAKTQADMMNCMGDGAMMENGDALEDQSSKRRIMHRHRRMIKNHESAARSRARKRYLPCCQNCWFLCNAISAMVSYTVELEAELNHLKEDKARLKAEEKMMEQSKEKVNAKKGGTLSRRNRSCI